MHLNGRRHRGYVAWGFAPAVPAPAAAPPAAVNEVAPGGSYAQGFQDGIMTGYAKGKAEAKGKGPKGDGKGAYDNSNKGKGPKAGDNQGKGKGKEKGKEVYYGFEVVDDDRPWV